MSLSVTALVVLVTCPLAWSLLDLARKQLASHGQAVPLTLLVVTANLPWLVLWAIVDDDWHVAPGYWLPACASLAVNILANLAYMQAVRLSPMSATVPLLSLTPAFATLLAVPMLGEVPGTVQILGVTTVVVGALLLNAPRAGADGSPGGWLPAMRREPGSLFMVATALLWSVSPALDKQAVGFAGTGVHALFLSVGIAGSLFVVLAIQGRLDEVRVRPGMGRPLFLAGIVGVVALALQLWAIQLVWVGLMETVKRGIGAILALVFGRLLFAEAIERHKILAVGLMIVGVWLVLA